MIEDSREIIPLFTKVIVKEFDAIGVIYERASSDSGHSVYGIRFNETVWPKGFVATKVWHCEREGIQVID